MLLIADYYKLHNTRQEQPQLSRAVDGHKIQSVSAKHQMLSTPGGTMMANNSEYFIESSLPTFDLPVNFASHFSLDKERLIAAAAAFK